MRSRIACAVGMGLLLAGCPEAPPATDAGGPDGPVRQRLAAKRHELAEGGTRPSPRARIARRSAAPPETSRQLPPDEPAPEPAAPGVVPSAPPSPPARAAEIPAHLSRHERLTRACYRDTFGVTQPAHVRYLLPREREFCRCMVDTVMSTNVSASLQDALIDNFKDRERVEATNPEFNRRWQRCRM